MRFDIAVVNYNADFYLLDLLRSVRRVLPAGAFGACHVWDNGSTDASVAVLEEVGREVGWLGAHQSPTNLHHGPALDRLLREHCRADWVLVLDSDTRLLHDFRSALPELADETPAFIGQIHPEPPQLYAYLCHLLVNRERYLTLPPFDADGAPGRAFFRAVVERGLHWRRFRWVDHVRHHGQGTLHGIVRRGETEHPLYRFALDESRRNPRWGTAVEAERPLRQALGRFLAEHGRVAPSRQGSGETARDSASPDAPGERHAPRIPAVPRPPRGWPFRPGSTSRLVRLAGRLGTGQREQELEWLFRRVRRRRPRRVLEVGRPAGGTLFLWTWAARARATLVSAGLPPWETDDPAAEARHRVTADLGRRRQTVSVIREDPLVPQVAARIHPLLAGAPLDFLFVTGEDDIEWLRRCLAAYVPLVRAGGLVALDGIRRRLGANDAVPELWRELERRYRTEVLVEDATRPGFGIGLIEVDVVARNGSASGPRP